MRPVNHHTRIYSLFLQILANEQETWEKIIAYVKENNVDCDLWVGKTVCDLVI